MIGQIVLLCNGCTIWIVWDVSGRDLWYHGWIGRGIDYPLVGVVEEVIPRLYVAAELDDL